MAGSSTPTAFTVAPYSWDEAHTLARELDLPEPLAIALVRRGHRTAAAAEAFLAASVEHDPFEFQQMSSAVELLHSAVRSRKRITVHGDYDVDGVCATAILVEALREAGGECDWVIPDRLGDGYGLTLATVQNLAGRGTEILVTVDCGISSHAEVAAAVDAGMEVLVTDHHEPPELLPDCTILHPRLSGYPCPDLCGTGVAFKLAEALRRGTHQTDETPSKAIEQTPSGLDLVALATVADMVPLRDENRSLVRRGLELLRNPRRPGLIALIAGAGIEPERLDEGDIAFRLAPRINAAGRLYRADAGVELLLTADPERATKISEELGSANRERRTTETDVVEGAEAALAELTTDPAELGALVLAGHGWHAGVVGIVASRLAERHWRPTVVISLSEDGTGRGSARSIPGFDLLAGLEACSEHLTRFGGHRAAAGLEIRAESIDAFREAFAVHAAAELKSIELLRSTPVDAVVGSDALKMGLAGQLERLAPFGVGNPDIRLLIPAARVSDIRRMGETEAHARFAINGGPGRAMGVAFNINGELAAVEQTPHDLGVKLEINRWNGAEHPRAVLRDVYGLDPGTPSDQTPPTGTRRRAVSGEDASSCEHPAAGEEWWGRFDLELSALPTSTTADRIEGSSAKLAGARSIVDGRNGSIVARVAELMSSGSPVLAVCSDAARRRELVEGVANPRRFGGGGTAVACGRCERDAYEAVRAIAAGAGIGLCDWTVLQLDPTLVEPFGHIVLVDPPPSAELESLALRGAGFTHRGWGAAEVELALRVYEAELNPHPGLAEIFRALRDQPDQTAEGDTLLTVLGGSGRFPRSPESAARCVRVLSELGVVGDLSASARVLRVVSSEKTQLESSSAFRVYCERHEESTRFLQSIRNPQ